MTEEALKPRISVEVTRWRFAASDKNGQEIGSMTLRLDKDGRFSVWDMLVLPECQRKGVATQLIEKAIFGAGTLSWLNNQKEPPVIWLKVVADSQPAINLYHKFGFVISGVVEANSVHPKRLIMEWKGDRDGK